MTAVETLRKYQKQCDPEGIEVQVSRQALDEVLDDFERVEGWVRLWAKAGCSVMDLQEDVKILEAENKSLRKVCRMAMKDQQGWPNRMREVLSNAKEKENENRTRNEGSPI